VSFMWATHQPASHLDPPAVDEEAAVDKRRRREPACGDETVCMVSTGRARFSRLRLRARGMLAAAAGSASVYNRAHVRRLVSAWGANKQPRIARRGCDTTRRINRQRMARRQRRNQRGARLRAGEIPALSVSVAKYFQATTHESDSFPPIYSPLHQLERVNWEHTPHRLYVQWLDFQGQIPDGTQWQGREQHRHNAKQARPTAAHRSSR